MIKRIVKNLGLHDGDAPEATRRLETDGWVVLRRVLEPDAVQELAEDIERVYDLAPSERSRTDKAEFRYEMLNRSAASQAVIGHPRMLEVVEPLLGEDCHVIANTAWRNPPDHHGGPWHTDAGPHVPRPADVPWDDRIPYPIFAVAAHVMLADCTAADGPTAIVPGSHRSGQLAPFNADMTLTYDGRPPVHAVAEAGDVVLFVSDAWHRGVPAAPDGTGRFFLQVHYGRRDIAQRLRTTDVANQLSDEAITRATDPRARELVGLHEPFFYDG